MAARSDEERLLDHSYDGIQEYDNPLPRWWVWIFWATFAFAVVYYFDFTGKIRGPGRIAEYNAAMAAAAKRWPAATLLDEAALTSMVKNPSVVAQGKQVFTTNCAPCHRPDGGGLIGPNLTDEYWLHGGKITDINKTITNGVLEKGMPNWGKILKPDQVNAVTAYVATLQGTNPPNPKPPQGDRVAK